MSTDYAKVNETQEILCQVITQIVQSELKGIKYDKTVKCTVTDASGFNYGYYKVSDGASEYVAYARENETYGNGDVVYVTIPNGDYSEQKFIMGRGFDENELNYSPLKNFMSAEQWSIPYGNLGIEANGGDLKKTIPILPTAKGNIGSETWIDKLNLNLLGGRDITHLLISANFSTSLPTCRRGIFGIEINLTYTNSKQQSKTEQAYFLNPDMYGTVYQLKNTTQKYILSMAHLDIFSIDELSFNLYQQNDFFDANGKSIESLGVKNIVLNSFKVEAGYSQKTMSPNSILIFADRDKTYVNKGESLGDIHWLFITDGGNGKYKRWINKTPEGESPYFYYFLEYDPSYKAAEGVEFEKDQWRLYSTSDKTAISDYTSKDQDKTGLEILLYQYIGDNRVIINKQSILFNKREKKEV